MPLVNIAERHNGSTIAVWEITETEEMLRRYLAEDVDKSLLSGHPRRRLERLATQVLLNTMTTERACLCHHENGRPYLENNKANISISHTKRFVAVIYNENETVGCDIECCMRDFSAVEKKALSDEERAYLSDEHRNFQLCILWCAKETIYKCVSEDGIDFAQQIFIEKFLPEEKGTLTARYTNNAGLVTKFRLQYKTIDDHVMVWTRKMDED